MTKAKSKTKTKAKAEPKLTAKQELFVAEYLANGYNATQAAISAGYSKKTAKEMGAENLAKPHIAAKLEAGKAKVLEKVNIDAEWLHRRLAEESDADIADLYDEDGVLKHPKDWPLVWRKGLVGGMDVEQLFIGKGEKRTRIGQVVKLKLSDRVKRLELLGKHVKVQAFKENINLEGKLDINDMSETERAARIAAIISKVAK